jgi:uncharacterized protein (DUF2267 family)
VDYAEFVETVRKRAHAGRDIAERAARATLETLAARISPAERKHLAGLLPAELGSAVLAVEGPRQVFGVPDFYRHVSERERVARPIAEEHVRAVFGALGLALSPEQLDHVAAELTPDYEELLAEAARARDEATRGPMSAAEFVRRVARRVQVDEDSARRATDAVLETLGEYLTRTEVDALIDALPAELHGPLQRSRDRTALDPDEFVRRVAEREGTTPGLAHEHARAVFTTLRAAVPDREFAHLEVELPGDLLVLIPDP